MGMIDKEKVVKHLKVYVDCVTIIDIACVNQIVRYTVMETVQNMSLNTLVPLLLC